MNICFLSLEHHSLGQGGGIASYLDALVPGLAGLGHEIHIIVKSKTSRTTKLEDGAYLHEFRGGNIHWYLSRLPLIGQMVALPVREIEWSLGFYRKLRALGREHRPDIIEGSETGNLLVALCVRKIPLVIRLHGSTYSFEKSTMGRASIGAKLDRVLQRFCLCKARGISAPSNFQKDMVDRKAHRKNLLEVIPNPVRAFNADEIRTSRLQASKMIFYAGRIADVKGIWTLLKAFMHIVAIIPEARLVMAGSSHISVPESVLQRFLKDNRIADKVTLTGYIERDRIGEYYKACAVYAAPSYYETFCISAVEAMLFEKPVVASSGTATEEIVRDHETGFLVPPGDDVALATAITRLLRDEQLSSRMGKAGKEEALSRFGPDVVALRTLAFYRRLIGEPLNKHIIAS